MTPRRFGIRQIYMLNQIELSGREGINEYRLCGRGRNSLSAWKSLRNAIYSHNSDICPSNCPLQKGWVITQEPLGPQGGMRYVLNIPEVNNYA